jgi:hypothetical protein
MDPPIRIRLWNKGKYKHWNSGIKGLQLRFKDLQTKWIRNWKKSSLTGKNNDLTIPFSRQKGRTTGAKIIVFSEVSGSVEHCQHNLLTYIEYRAVSGVFRTIDPTPPLHPASVSSPRTKGGGVHTRRAVRGWGSIFQKTSDIGLASYSKIPLRLTVTSRDVCSCNCRLSPWLKSSFVS